MEEEKGQEAEAEVLQETEEEREARLAREEAEKVLAEAKAREISQANCARVEFTAATVKDIVSPHSSSILAKDGPVVPLSNKMEEAARTAFAATATSGDEDAVATIPATPDVLGKLMSQIEATPFSADSADEQQLGCLMRSVSGVLRQQHVETMDLEAFLSFASRFYNPPYYYGERVRKLVGRGCLEDCLDIFTRGCSINTADGEGTCALHYCAEFNRVDIIKALADLFQGALMLNAKDKQGWTPLYNAVHYGNIESVQELLDRGASVNSSNVVGKTALHCAAAQGRAPICNLLLSSGANPTAPDSTGMTPLHEAAYKAQQETYKLLLAAEGADPSLRDRLGNKAEDYLGDFSPTDGADAGSGSGLEAEAEALPAPPTPSSARSKISSKK
jgi:ankyrin repeat protein